MQAKFLLVTLLVLLQYKTISCQRQWIPPTTTAAEMRNPYTWYWPYAIAASEAYREYFINAQQISNQLYQQAHITGAFPWSQGNQNNPNNPNNPNVPSRNTPRGWHGWRPYAQASYSG